MDRSKKRGNQSLEDAALPREGWMQGLEAVQVIGVATSPRHDYELRQGYP